MLYVLDSIFPKKYNVRLIVLWHLLSFFLCTNTRPAFKLGVDNIPQSFIKKIKKNGFKIGLITNQTGMDTSGKNRTIDILRAKAIDVVALYVPEHGLTGSIRAGLPVADGVDEKTGIPIVSLYENESGKKITAAKLAAIDMLIFDIQDSGMRHYTYISTLFTALQAAAEYKKHFVVLDRPNPLGSIISGPLVEPDLVSFISIAPIPLRHGMTMGEFALYCNKYLLAQPAHLHVIPMHNYRRLSGIPGGLQYALSPNIQTIQACYGYSFLGLLGEIKPFDIGIGSPLAFQTILLPESLGVGKDVWKQAQKKLLSHGIKSYPHQRFNENAKCMTIGLRLDIADVGTLPSFDLFCALVHLFKHAGVNLVFSASFDKAVGTKKAQQLFTGALSEITFWNGIHNDLVDFYKRAERIFIYKPRPIC